MNEENIKLHNGDCLEVMKDIHDNSVDMVLCDLPYGTTRNKWDSIIPLDKLWEQYSRICRDNAAIVLFSQAPFDKVLGASNLDMLKYEWIWEKENGTGFLNAKKMPLKIHENILVFYKELPVYNPQMRSGTPYIAIRKDNPSKNYGEYHECTTVSNGDRYPISILKFKRDKNKVHPTQKPVALLEYLIKTYTNEGMTVLDNTMGSGSTMVACVNTNRKGIGIELDENYFNIAKERIDEAIEEKQSKLF